MFRAMAIHRGAGDGAKYLNPVHMMAPTPAPVARQPRCKQLAGMRGLMAKPSGEIIETPIIRANFREGLSVLEYFISTHGARKGLADTALKTADSGYLTRPLWSTWRRMRSSSRRTAAPSEGMTAKRADLQGRRDRRAAPRPASARPHLAQDADLRNPIDSARVLVKKNGDLIDRWRSRPGDRPGAGIEQVRIRSVADLPDPRAASAACYGMDLARPDAQVVNIGEAVGVIAAQSIGEPGTQLTMRTFHYRWYRRAVVSEQSQCPGVKNWRPRSSSLNIKNGRVTDSAGDLHVVINRNGKLLIVKDEQGARARARHARDLRLASAGPSRVKDKVEQGARRWSSGTRSPSALLTEKEGFGGKVDLTEDIIDGRGQR